MSAFLVFFLFILISRRGCENERKIPKCSNLPIEYFDCQSLFISKNTYEIEGCQKNHTVPQSCTIKENILCDGTELIIRHIPCRYTNGKRYSVVLFISFFLGFLGVDRIYLGYVSLGLFKMMTFGFFGLGWVYDLILISSGRLRPLDGSHYVRGYLFSFSRFRLGRNSTVYWE